ncbi:hypothetical protein E1301_Tti019178 [Triplophysa tibetana]|uniref:TBC1 domain-containing protein n=1 Tax=Triplophysa tibetana TaxID=1572043 RepID=A0A5A9N822_9TELE|nr:hypothetical protein E1301_Tti019178 [Triplophysa tibetana]
MLSCCCGSSLACPEVWSDKRKSFSADEDRSSMDIRMDIALLKDQYNSIRDKQRREPQVVCFKKDVNSEEICRKALVDMVPVAQIKQTPLSDTSVLETQFNSTEDSDGSLWRTHLDVYRMTHASNSTEHASHTSDFSDDVTDDPVSTDDSSTDLSEYVSQDSDTCVRNHSLINSTSMTSSGLSSREMSSPARLSRQLSFGSYRSCLSPAGPQKYPFPQMKCLKKSETARRLGLYSSF